MIENWRSLFFTTLGAILALAIPYVLEKYREAPISADYSNVSLSVGSRGDFLFDTIDNFLKTNNYKDFYLPSGGIINITPIAIKNTSDRRVSNIELIVQKDAFVIRHNNSFIGKYGLFSLSGAQLERDVNGKIMIPSIDPSHVSLYTVISGGYSGQSQIQSLLVDGRSVKISANYIENDIYGLKNFVNNNEFFSLTFLMFGILSIFTIFIAIYAAILKTLNFDSYFSQFGKSQLKDAKKLLEYENQKNKEETEEVSRT